MSSGARRSAVTAMARPPAAAMASAVVTAPGSSMSTTATAAPSAANRPQMALPMPLAPPVTMATLPSRRVIAA